MDQQPHRLYAARRRILIVSSAVISAEQTAPGNRCWQLAGQLSQGHDVILALPRPTRIFHPDCAVLYYQPRSVGLLARDCDAVISDAAALASHFSLLGSGTPVAVDLAAWEPPDGDVLSSVQQRVLAGADFFFCGDEGARRRWLNTLAYAGRVNAYTQEGGDSLRRLIDTVPLDDRTKGEVVYWQLQALEDFCRAPRFARDRGTPFCLAPEPATAGETRWHRLARRAPAGLRRHAKRWRQRRHNRLN